MSLNELGEKSQATVILGKFCKQTIIKLSLAYSFRKIFFHWSKFKARSHEIFFSWSFVFFFLEKYCMWIKTSWGTNYEIPLMNLFLILMLKKPEVKLKLLWINFNVSQFHEHIFRSSRLQMFFKIGGLKYFAILRIKKALPHIGFPVRSNHAMWTYW